MILLVGVFIYFKADNRIFDLLILFLLFWVNFPSVGFVLPFIFVFSYLLILSLIKKSYPLLTGAVFILALLLSFFNRTEMRDCLLLLLPILFVSFKNYRQIRGVNLLKLQYAISGILIFSLAILINQNYFIAIISLLGLTGYALTLKRLLNGKVVLIQVTTLLVGSYLLHLSFYHSNLWFLSLSLFIFGLSYLLVKTITSEKEKEEIIERLTIELENVNSELSKLDQSKLGFASIASHQLRTPLTAIKGYLSMIIDGTYGKVSPKIKEKMRNVMESNERLIRLVNELLSLSRIEIGKTKLELEVLSVEKIIEQAIKDLKVVATKKGLYLKFSRPKTKVPDILIDEWKIRQVLINIIDNAIKYTEKGGVTVKLRREGDDAKIEICDTGEGIEGDELKMIFELFLRGRSGNHLSPEGSGLGLYIAQKLMEMHQGKIWAESEGKNKGSCFYILIPIKR